MYQHLFFFTNETAATKLMDLLSHEDSGGAITWLPHGKSFVIISVEKLAKILPLHFKDHKFSSFVRKLYRWGFRQVEKGPNAQSFFHRNFQRDGEELCQQISCSPFIINNGLHDQATGGENKSRGTEQMPCSDVLMLRRRIAISQARVLAHKQQISFALDSLPNTSSSMPALTPPRFRRHSLAFGDLGRTSNTFRRNNQNHTFEDLEERTKQLQNNMRSLLRMSGKGEQNGLYDCPFSPDAAHVIQQAVDVLK
uniref:HSF-type DNA-binding domain-containing protein n=1 Tax=Odontella aurita TaxID=265563 RepID=A0A7S4J7G3_9STRA|mmetsp:Transcript_40354/g.121588  ORF Transcript_40354/g.121588 Transcript_40354/m.121588 type:complete len:253 (+) Transcript_40354:503-1261(+)